MSVASLIELLQIAAIGCIAWALAKQKDVHGIVALVLLLFAAVLVLLNGFGWR